MSFNILKKFVALLFGSYFSSYSDSVDSVRKVSDPTKRVYSSTLSWDFLGQLLWDISQDYSFNEVFKFCPKSLAFISFTQNSRATQALHSRILKYDGNFPVQGEPNITNVENCRRGLFRNKLTGFHWHRCFCSEFCFSIFKNTHLIHNISSLVMQQIDLKILLV